MGSAKTKVYFVLIFLLGSVVCFAENGPDQKMEQMREKAQRAKREAFEKAKAKRRYKHAEERKGNTHQW